MGFADPFPGYSVALRVILYGAVPLFSLWQVVRLRRALHVFQLEGYKRARFLRWCRSNGRRALFLRAVSAKKPLVMTGRAWRLLSLATLLSVLLVLLASAGAHLGGGWPWDIPTWAATTIAVFIGAPVVLAAADWMLAPVQRAINARYVRAARRKLAAIAPVVVGVTGSYGKTSTKFAVARLLGAPEEVLATPGSFNTPLGVCRAINERLAPSHRYLVVEMGAYGVGEIRELCDLVAPSIGVLTAIGPAHLERFGSLAAIRRAKYELIESLPPAGVAVMNSDDEEVRALAAGTRQPRVVRYGMRSEGDPDVTATDVRVTASGMSLVIAHARTHERIAVQTRLLGSHAVRHILAAVAVAGALGRSLADLRAPIAELEPVEHRLQILEGTAGVTVIDDAYNSNPEGAAEALEVLDAMPARRKVVVSPGMIELGPMQYEANERFGEHAARVADAVVVVAGINRAAIVSGARRADGRVEVVTVDSLAEAQDELARLVGAGDVVLFENDLPDHLES